MNGKSPQQRIVIGMIDGLGLDYMTAQPLPALHHMATMGLRRDVAAIMPTVTNVNNVSISCGALPNEHGLTGNSYYNAERGEAAPAGAGFVVARAAVSGRDHCRVPRGHGVVVFVSVSARPVLTMTRMFAPARSVTGGVTGRGATCDDSMPSRLAMSAASAS